MDSLAMSVKVSASQVEGVPVKALSMTFLSRPMHLRRQLGQSVVLVLNLLIHSLHTNVFF